MDSLLHELLGISISNVMESITIYMSLQIENAKKLKCCINGSKRVLVAQTKINILEKTGWTNKSWLFSIRHNGILYFVDLLRYYSKRRFQKTIKEYWTRQLNCWCRVFFKYYSKLDLAIIFLTHKIFIYCHKNYVNLTIVHLDMKLLY